MKFEDLSSLLRAAMIATPLMFAAACGDEDKDVDVDPEPTDETDETDETDDTDDTDEPTPTPEGTVQVVHFAKDAGNVDIFVNEGETAAFSDLAYKGITASAALEPADYSFQVAPTGETAADAILTVDSFTVEDGGEYTFAAIGDATDTDTDSDFGATVIAVTAGTEEVGSDKVEVTVVHAGVGIGEVDIYNASDLDSPVALVSDVAFGEQAALGLVDATDIVVGIDTDNDPATMELLFGAPFSLVAGTRISVFAVDDSDEVATLQVVAGGSIIPINPGIDADPQ